MKSQIVEELGNAEVLLPSLIADGLRANDRVKARLSMLQEVGRRAASATGGHGSGVAPFDLGEECRAVGLDVAAMEALAGHATLVAGKVTAPGLGALGAGIWADVEAMIHAVGAGDAGAGDAGAGDAGAGDAGAGDAGATAARRLEALRAGTALGSGDALAPADILALTSLSAEGRDSLHRLIMDLHKDLNRLAASHAEEVLAGAHVYGLKAEDRPAVEAFMRGVEATRRLKFDHPGLATVATRAGDRLTIQNDIGETDAHVVVITQEADTITVTYSDVHRARAKFFVACFDDFPAQWSGLGTKSVEGLAEGGVFFLVTGRLTDTDRVAREAFLEALGAALVFLIDWNKARKTLRSWVPKADAVRILQWAARNRIGHRGFLEMGGSELVAAAVHHAAPTRIGFGERLDGVLGREAAVSFLEAVLRISAEALLDGSALRLARDRIEAELVGRLERVDTALLDVVIRQAGLAREVAVAIAQHVDDLAAGRGSDADELARRARAIEQKADRIALEARGEIARLDADPAVAQLVNRIEEAIDDLEQAAFIASLAPQGLDGALLAALGHLARLAVAGTEAAAMGVAATAEIPEGSRIDSEAALAAFGRLIEIEHEGDVAERAVTTQVLRGDFDLRAALAALELARALERSTDQLAGFGHLLHAQVLADLTK
ncbi:MULTISPECIES: hypothetical protein [unclassified Xanthobacter]|uniref:hypothetical protein n=1 Tax=unclassified Xanthobacter TaxID=2623496 RepID=UPI001EDF1D1D|nr:MULTISPECIES: hypothetical protein [unclassified Xanthobacter]